MITAKTRRVFTCTPVRFKGDHTFFARDSGLLSVGLRMNGMESKAVMPGPPMADDDPYLIRAAPAELESAEWWRVHELDAVVFFSWAMPSYTRIAEAIKASGTKLIVFLDSAGFWSPWSEGRCWFAAQWNACVRKRGLALGATRFVASIFRSCLPRTFDHPRLHHMNLADAVTVTSPLVMDRTRNYARIYGYASLQNKIHHLPLPVSPHMCYEGQQKRKRVICVARWLPQDWPEKGPKILLDSLTEFLECRPDYEALVIGRGATALKTARFYSKSLNDRNIRLLDYLPNSELPPLLAKSQISICSSFHESYHIASFEAACCGCSVVALKSPDLPALQYLAQTDGTLAATESPEAFRNALCHEADLWDRAARNPVSISEHWQEETHAPYVANRLMQLIDF